MAPAPEEHGRERAHSTASEFTIRSMLFSAVFTIMLVAVVIVDLAALLQFSGLISGIADQYPEDQYLGDRRHSYRTNYFPPSCDGYVHFYGPK